MSRSIANIIALMLLTLGAAEGEVGTVAAPGPVGKETVVIRADKAWEEPDSDRVLHFKGNFELHSPDWSLLADEADLYGPLDDPDRIVARGTPVRVTIVDGEERVIGRALQVEYVRANDILTLREGAELEGESIAMSSSVIVFDVAAKRLKSSGDTGVEMILQRDIR